MHLPEDFMARVVAWPGENPGYVNLHWLPAADRGPGLRGKPFKDLRSFMDMAQYAATKPAIYKELFFCLSSQKMTGKVIHGKPVAHRHSSQALHLKAIWLDVDVKPEAYPTLSEASSAILTLCTQANLPPPSAMVYSGGGVHAYWISGIPLSEAHWRPYAEGLKYSAMQYGLKFDAGLTTDPVRILRIPGTYNNKIPGKPRPVRLAFLGDSYEFSTQFAHLAALAPVKTELATAAVTKERPRYDLTGWSILPAMAHLDAKADSLDAGIGGAALLDLPLAPDEVIRGCSHFQDAAFTKGAGHGQGLWALTLLASTFLDNGRGWAHQFSKGYKTYDKGETDAKYDEKLNAKVARNLGWPSCRAFEAEGAKCKSCPFYNKIRSPLALAKRVDPPAGTVVVHAPPSAEPDLDLPEGFAVNHEGIISAIVQKTLSNGAVVEEHQPLFMSRLRNFEAQSGDRRFNFETSLDGNVWGNVSIPELSLQSEQTLVRELLTYGVKPYFPNQKLLRHFMTSFLARLDKAKQRIQTISFGWMMPPEGGSLPLGFAYGGKIYKSDGTTQASGASDPQLDKHYSPKGTPDAWLKAHKLITDQHHPALEVIAAMGFAAPLMWTTGQYNCVICAWSPGGGAGKSTSVASGSSVWGSPKLTKERPLSSQKGILRKMGHLRNLPVYWDEISDDGKMDEIRQILGYVTEGSDGSKLRQDRTLYELQEWQTLMLVGANKSLMENIMANVSDTDAQLHRVFEFQVEKRKGTANQNDVSRLIAELDHNYGHMGVKYAELIGRDPSYVDSVSRTVQAKLNKAVFPQPEERFRCATMVAIYTGALLANSIGAAFNIDEIWDFLVAEFKTQREIISSANIVAGSSANTVGTFTQFLKAHTRNILWVQSIPMPGRGKPLAISYLAGPNREHPDPIQVRMAVSDRIIQVSKKRFDAHMVLTKQASGQVLKSLKVHFGAVVKDRVDLARGAGVAGGRETIIEIPVPPQSPFSGDLFTHVPISDRPDEVDVSGIDVTAAVTAPTPAIAEVRSVLGEVVAAAAAQAAKDAETVRKAAS